MARVGAVIAGAGLLLCMGASGCGPVRYIKQVTLEADASVAAAKAANAETYAPYWYTLAVEYLHQAREEAALADFEAANRFGHKAHQAALEAKRLAVQRAAHPDDKDWMPPPSLREQGATLEHDKPVEPDTDTTTDTDQGNASAPEAPDVPDVVDEDEASSEDSGTQGSEQGGSSEDDT